MKQRQQQQQQQQEQQEQCAISGVEFIEDSVHIKTSLAVKKEYCLSYY